MAYVDDRLRRMGINRRMGVNRSYVGFAYSHAIVCSSAALDAPIVMDGNAYPYPQPSWAERFSKEVVEKAWKMLEEPLTETQFKAFMDEKTVELSSRDSQYRLLVNRTGAFTMLEGAVGDGIVLLQGTIREGEFPLGDEIAAFIDWFIYKPDELIKNWRCGNFTIKRKGK